MVVTLVAVAGAAMALANVTGPGAVILGGGLALSSTAVAMQVLQDRGESGSRHGRATFAVLLLQVVLFPCIWMNHNRMASISLHCTSAVQPFLHITAGCEMLGVSRTPAPFHTG